MAVDYQPSGKDEAIALAVVGGLLGAGLLFFGLTKRGGDQHHLRPDETLGGLSAPGLAANGQVHVALGTPITINNPTCIYSGNGRTAYAYFQIKQGPVTVYASGIPIMPIGPASTPTQFPLVPANECQCVPPCIGSDCCTATGPLMTAYPWPGTDPCNANSVPICGRPAVAGAADAYLEIYEDQTESGLPGDGVGYAPSPTCSNPPRAPLVGSVKFPNAFVFV